MIQLIKKNNIVEILYVIAFGLYIFCETMYNSSFMAFQYVRSLADIGVYISYCGVICKIAYDVILRKFSLNEFLISLLLVLFGIYIQKTSGSNSFAFLFLYMMGAKNIEDKSFCKFIFVILSLAFIIIIFSSLSGHIENYARIIKKKNVVLRERYMLGFLWPTFAPNYFLTIVLLYMVFRKKLLAIEYVVIGIINIVLYGITDTRCSFLCIWVALILYFVVVNRKLLKKLFFLSTISFPALVTFVMYKISTVEKNNDFLLKLDKILNNRVNLIQKGYKAWGIKPFGSITDMDINMDGNANFIDCSYINILLNNGWVILVIIILLLMIYCYVLYKKDNMVLLIAVFVYMLHSAIEPQLVNLNYNCFWVLFLPNVLSYIEEVKAKKNLPKE